MAAKTKSQLMMDLKNARARGEQWQKAVTKQLNKALGVGTRFGNPGGKGRMDTPPQYPGSVALQTGISPNDQKVAEYIQSIGGNPYARQAQVAQEGLRQLKAGNTGASPAIAQQAARTVDRSLGIERKKNKREAEREKKRAREDLKARRGEAQQRLQTFLEDAQEQYDAANAANEERYDAILQDLTDSKERNLERVENYGVAAEADLEERFANTLGDIKANLSARGLGNSTILDAFRSRNERDLAREQQRLAEQVDSRTAEYDMNRTDQIAGFMERRNDVAPDFAGIANLAQQFGLGGDGLGYEDTVEYQSPMEEEEEMGVAERSRAHVYNNVQNQPVAEAPPGVPQPTISQYQPQPRGGINARNANQVAYAWQNQMPNFLGLTGYVPSPFKWTTRQSNAYPSNPHKKGKV